MGCGMNEQALADLMALLPLEGAPAHEGQVASYIRQRLLAMGVAADQIVYDNAQAQSEYGGEVGNMIVRLEGRSGGASSPRLMFSTHMDTVPIAVGCAPRLDRAGNRIVNEAAGKALGGDNRLGCAALLDLVGELMRRKGDHPPITLVFFVQEEVGLVGARGLDVRLLGDPMPAMCYNLDGGRADEFVTKVIGAERFTIDITGIAAHAGAHPEGGVSAAVIAARAIAALEGAGWHGRIEKAADVGAGGVGSANVGILQGGQGSNVVMPSLHILAEARSHDPAFRRRIIETWKEEFRQAAAAVANQQGEHGAVSFGRGPIYEAFALADDAPVVQRLLRAAAICGMDARTVSNDGGMDANWIVAHGIPAVTLGVGQRAVHTPDEWIDLGDFAATCALIRTLVTMGE
jgi:tripeptide aminopeptidase